MKRLSAAKYSEEGPLLSTASQPISVVNWPSLCPRAVCGNYLAGARGLGPAERLPGGPPFHRGPRGRRTYPPGTAMRLGGGRVPQSLTSSAPLPGCFPTVIRLPRSASTARCSYPVADAGIYVWMSAGIYGYMPPTEHNIYYRMFRPSWDRRSARFGSPACWRRRQHTAIPRPRSGFGPLCC